MKPLECPSCNDSSSFKETGEKAGLAIMNEDTDNQNFQNIIEVSCDNCGTKTYFIAAQWREFVRVYL